MTNETPPPTLHREPIEADREAAANLWLQIPSAEWVEWQEQWLRDGTGDNGPIVQAFMRHRVEFSTPAASDAEGMAFVPLQPTDAMFEAAAKAWDGALSTYWAQEMWHAMIEAATPSTEGRKGE